MYYKHLARARSLLVFIYIYIYIYICKQTKQNKTKEGEEIAFLRLGKLFTSNASVLLLSLAKLKKGRCNPESTFN